MPKGLRLSADRERAILENTGEPFYFEHEQITDVDEFRDGISENQIDVNPFGIPLYATLQANEGAREKIRQLDKVIERAAKDPNVHPDFLRAIIYTEESRGWYDHWTKYVRESPTWLPGNVLKKWEALIPGSDFEDTQDNIRITAEFGCAHSEVSESALPRGYLRALQQPRAWSHLPQCADQDDAPLLQAGLAGEGLDKTTLAHGNALPRQHAERRVALRSGRRLAASRSLSGPGVGHTVLGWAELRSGDTRFETDLGRGRSALANDDP